MVFIHGAILSDGFVPVIEQTGIAENFQIVHYRRRGYAGSSRALAGMTMQGWPGDCIALLDHVGMASAHVAGHSFGAGIALHSCARSQPLPKPNQDRIVSAKKLVSFDPSLKDRNGHTRK